MSRNDERSPDFERRAAELDRLADVPTEVLDDVVERDGTCWWVTAPIALVHSAAVLVLWLAGGLLALGGVLAVAHSDLTWVLAPLNTAVQTVAWSVWLVDAVWRPLLIALAGLGVVAVWEVGRRSGALPGTAALRHAERHGALPTVSALAAAAEPDACLALRAAATGDEPNGSGFESPLPPDGSSALPARQPCKSTPPGHAPSRSPPHTPGSAGSRALTRPPRPLTMDLEQRPTR